MRGDEYYQYGRENSEHGSVPASASILTFPINAIERPIDREWKFLKELGFSKPLLAALRERAEENGTTIEAELLADGRINADAYYGALARVLDLPFLDRRRRCRRSFRRATMRRPTPCPAPPPTRR